MNKKTKELIDKEFLQVFLTKCNEIFSGTIKTYEDLANISNSAGWHDAFLFACRCLQKEKLYSYYSLLEWNESDNFANDLNCEVLKENLFDTAQQLEEAIQMAEMEYQDIENTYEFIWGIPSFDNLMGVVNLHSLNDLDIIYHKQEKKFFIEIETIYYFKTKTDYEQYIVSLLKQFTEWMVEQKYDINYKISWRDLFNYSFQEGFDTIEEAYTYFKIITLALCESGYVTK